jgi:glycosyltransferase involved in cell wall biosynthesis
MTPKVSVCTITYNHEKYIGEAIESILKQNTNFGYEIVIGEDCSTDKTKKIIIKYQKKYPNKIKLILNKKNLGIMPSFIQTLKACKGKYIALLEGDDYWTDPHKLQKQVDFLDNNQNYTISSHNVCVTQEGSRSRTIKWLGENHRKTSTLKDILKFGSGGATCSLVFRNDKEILSELYKLTKKISGADWLLQIVFTKYGKMRYFSESMGVYRKHIGGISSAKNKQEEVDIFNKGGVKTCEVIDDYLNYEYSREINYNLINYFYFNLFRIYKKYQDFEKAKFYSKKIILNYMSFDKKTIKNILELLIPFHPLRELFLLKNYLFKFSKF